MWPISMRVKSPDNDDASLLDRTTDLSDYVRRWSKQLG
jgi:hypothetical protein